MSSAIQELLAYSRPRTARTQPLSWSQPPDRLAARVRRPGDRPGAGRRPAHRRGRPAACIRCMAISCVPATPVPIIYEVDRIRDGGSFTTRRVVAIQHGQAIFSLSASFQVDEPGLSTSFRCPTACRSRRRCLSEKELIKHFIDKVPERVRRYWERERPIEMRPVSSDALSHAREADRPSRISGSARPARCRTTGHPGCGAGLYLRHDAARHVALRPWPRGLRPGHAGGEPRPRDVVPPADASSTTGCSMRRTARVPPARAASPAACSFRVTARWSPRLPRKD